MNEDDDRNLAEKLHRWTIKEMHFHPQGKHINSSLPTSDNFRDVCRGPMKDVWKFVISHVHSSQTVKKVTGNLALKGHLKPKTYTVKYKSETQYDDQKTDLLERRAQLSREVTSVLSDVNHLENDLHRLQEEIISTETEYQASHSALSDLRRKTALLQAFSQQCQDKNQQYEEYTSRITTKVDTVLQRSKKSLESDVFYSKERSSVDDDDDVLQSPVLETACSRCVRETCETIGTFLREVLQGTFGADKDAFHQKKERLWCLVENVLSEFSVQQVVRALVTNAQTATLDLREARSRIDIRRDAEKLKFKYEKGELKDVSSTPTLLQSVHQLAEEGNLQYIERFIAAERYDNETWRIEKQFNEVKVHIEKKLKEIFRKKPGDLQLARTVIDTDLELVADRASLHCLTEESDRMREKISQRMIERGILYTKHQKIKDFQEIADKKQNLIRILVKQNANSKSRLDSQQDEIIQYIQRALLNHHADVKALTSGITGSLVSEVEKFAGLVLPYLMFSSVDSSLKMAVMDLSINHCCHPESVSQRQALQTTLKHVTLPGYQAAECILKHCFDRKCDTEYSVMIAESQDVTYRRIGKHPGERDIIELLRELTEAVSEHDRKQIEKSLPVLQQRMNKAAKALTNCIQAKESEQAWWEQPAFYTTTWLTVNNHSLQQWLDRWRVLVTKLRQTQTQRIDP